MTRVSGKLFSRNLCLRTLFAGWGMHARWHGGCALHLTNIEQPLGIPEGFFDSKEAKSRCSCSTKLGLRLRRLELCTHRPLASQLQITQLTFAWLEAGKVMYTVRSP